VHSLSDVVREEAAARGLPPERGPLIAVGNELRRALGPGALAERILPRLGERDVVDSIRNPAEVEVLRRAPGFLLVAVRATQATRFARSLARARPGDPVPKPSGAGAPGECADPAGQRLDHGGWPFGLGQRRRPVGAARVGGAPAGRVREPGCYSLQRRRPRPWGD
jgi:hypothetical protein